MSDVIRRALKFTTRSLVCAIRCERKQRVTLRCGTGGGRRVGEVQAVVTTYQNQVLDEVGQPAVGQYEQARHRSGDALGVAVALAEVVVVRRKEAKLPVLELVLSSGQWVRAVVSDSVPATTRYTVPAARAARSAARCDGGMGVSVGIVRVELAGFASTVL
uniref:Uncharacterized protein n=1 Tax=Anopheles farauti TaxID=69004 RepID=A0A182Q0J7_9DIPT